MREKPDLVLALGGDVAPYAVKATSTIPIVFVSSADPVQLGLAASLARPAGNATGVTLLLDDTASKRLEFLKEAVPRVRHAAFLWNPDHPDNELRETQRAAQNLNMQLQLVEMRGSGDLNNAFRAVIDGGCDALYVVSSRHTVLNIPPIVDFATKNKLPLAGAASRRQAEVYFSSQSRQLAEYSAPCAATTRHTERRSPHRLRRGTHYRDRRDRASPRAQLHVETLRCALSFT